MRYFLFFILFLALTINAGCGSDPHEKTPDADMKQNFPDMEKDIAQSDMMDMSDMKNDQEDIDQGPKVCKNPYPENFYSIRDSWKESWETYLVDIDDVQAQIEVCEDDNECAEMGCPEGSECYFGCLEMHRMVCGDKAERSMIKVRAKYAENINMPSFIKCEANIFDASGNPIEADTDEDGLSNYKEWISNTDPCNPYTDSANICQLDKDKDLDGDGILNHEDEYTCSTEDEHAVDRKCIH